MISDSSERKARNAQGTMFSKELQDPGNEVVCPQGKFSFELALLGYESMSRCPHSGRIFTSMLILVARMLTELAGTQELQPVGLNFLGSDGL